MANEHTHQGPPKSNFPGLDELRPTPPVPPAYRMQGATLWSFLRLFSRPVHPTANEHTHQGPPKSNFPRE